MIIPSPENMGVLYNDIVEGLNNLDTSTIHKELPLTAYGIFGKPIVVELSTLIGTVYFGYGVKINILNLVNYLTVCIVIRGIISNEFSRIRFPVQFPLYSAVISLILCFTGTMFSGMFKGNILMDIKDIDVVSALIIWLVIILYTAFIIFSNSNMETKY